MKTRTIVATLLIVAAVSADARFAPPYPRKPVSPDGSGHWIAINTNLWPHGAEFQFTTAADGQTRRGEASPSGGGPDRRKALPIKKEKGSLPGNYDEHT